MCLSILLDHPKRTIIVRILGIQPCRDSVSIQTVSMMIQGMYTAFAGRRLIASNRRSSNLINYASYYSPNSQLEYAPA
jgi:hypothetical protein